jgi:hypothetical protein
MSLLDPRWLARSAPTHEMSREAWGHCQGGESLMASAAVVLDRSRYISRTISDGVSFSRLRLRFVRVRVRVRVRTRARTRVPVRTRTRTRTRTWVPVRTRVRVYTAVQERSRSCPRWPRPVHDRCGHLKSTIVARFFWTRFSTVVRLLVTRDSAIRLLGPIGLASSRSDAPTESRGMRTLPSAAGVVLKAPKSRV